MEQSKNYQKLIEALKNTSKSLSLNIKSQLNKDILAICNYLNNPNFRIAVFGPFNHGKSTLLNAMLGSKTLPIDLIPTTGAAITVKYGSDIRTRIILADGSEIYRSGTDILKQFAILDNDRRMRGDVASVEVFYPHSFLETGIEFLDLPGTNDREAQDNLVREQLLSADLVVQLLDARKLMTLGERENLRDWLLDRGIKTVIFVANFLNLLEPEEQKEVQNRLRFVAESFRAELPPGFSNLYRVDALPALRARLKGDVSAANTSGLVEFETALQNIAGILKQNNQVVSKPRVQAVAFKLQLELKEKINPIQHQVQKINEKSNAANEIKRKAEGLIKQGFTASTTKLREWLALSKLREKYQGDGAIALAQDNFSSWERETLKKDLQELQQAVTKWLYQADDFFQNERPNDLLIPFPKHPQVTLPDKNGNSGDLNETGSLAVGGGIGWLLGGPVGAAVLGSISYLVNKNIQQQDEKSSNESYHQQVAKLCLDAVDGYLSEFSRQGLLILAECDRSSERVIKFVESKESSDIILLREELRCWQVCLSELNQALVNCLGIDIHSDFHVETVAGQKTSNYQSVYRSQGVGIREDVGTRKVESKKVEELKPENKIPKQQQTSNYSTSNFSNSNATSTKSSYQKYHPKQHLPELDGKFRNWEIDEEIAQMKANMGSSGNRTQQQQSNQVKNQSKTQIEKDKIACGYVVLGLKDGATMDEVKQAYKKLVKKWHPDLFVGKAQQLQEAQEKMRQINEAYALLGELNK
ncbi:dynamin family protein [Brunnivagina elsteri]|uniref:Dynamin family protein n=1 Tax=Brunnivagina elsteri CCALA 953 TaxID=987040 RepID=A0A2A2TPT6_9CYAN|nr:dynamin family protein [Calothrix elsteri]PAX60443.1 dynamin family protein [Calothrix elsteri CCALA 953]